MNKIISKKFECDNRLIEKLKLKENKLDDMELIGIVGARQPLTKGKNCHTKA